MVCRVWLSPRFSILFESRLLFLVSIGLLIGVFFLDLSVFYLPLILSISAYFCPSLFMIHSLILFVNSICFLSWNICSCRGSFDPKDWLKQWTLCVMLWSVRKKSTFFSAWLCNSSRLSSSSSNLKELMNFFNGLFWFSSFSMGLLNSLSVNCWDCWPVFVFYWGAFGD